jgi:hypothetical protein
VVGAGCLKGCLGRAWLLGLLIATAFAGWKWGPAVFPRVQGWFAEEEAGVEVLPSPELAAAALDRFERFRRGESGDQLSLSATEVASVLRYSAPGMVPGGVSSPAVEFQDGVVTLTARIAVEAFPGLPTLDGILGFLPDTVSISVEGALAPLDQDGVALVVHGVRASFIPVPLPDGMTPSILTALGRRNTAGLPEDALAFPLPDGVGSAHVLRNRLILVRDG